MQKTCILCGCDSVGFVKYIRPKNKFLKKKTRPKDNSLLIIFHNNSGYRPLTLNF